MFLCGGRNILGDLYVRDKYTRGDKFSGKYQYSDLLVVGAIKQGRSFFTAQSSTKCTYKMYMDSGISVKIIKVSRTSDIHKYCGCDICEYIMCRCSLCCLARMCYINLIQYVLMQFENMMQHKNMMQYGRIELQFFNSGQIKEWRF